MKHFLVVLVLAAAPVFATPTLEIKSTTKAAEVVRVEIELTAAKVVEIPALNTVQINEPVFTFSEDIGYGNTVLPRLKVEGLDGDLHSWVSAYICKEFGYGKPKAALGTRPILAGVVMQYYGNPNDSNSKGLTIEPANSLKEVPANLTCEFKKP